MFCLKGKVFFLYSEAFVRNPSLSTETDTVPNAAFRNGDFSSLITGNTATNHYIKDPSLRSLAAFRPVGLAASLTTVWRT